MTPAPQTTKLEPIIEKSEVLGIPSTHVTKCTVVEVNECEEVKVGDTVLVKKTKLTDFNQEDGVYLFVRESEILAIL
jgi:co-chaperonin GroES (HSP10)